MNHPQLESNMGVYSKTMQYLQREFPRTSVRGLCNTFGYKKYVTDIICGMEEDEFNEVYPVQHDIIQKEFSNWRSGERTPYETIQDIFSNFLMEDLLLKKIIEFFPYLNGRVRLNGEEDRDIVMGRPKNLPDFIFTNKDGEDILVELKRSMSNWSIERKQLILKFNEFEDYTKYGAIVLHWLPNEKKAMFINFRHSDQFNVSKGNTTWGVPSAILEINPDDLFDFDIKNKDDVENMLKILHKTSAE